MKIFLSVLLFLVVDKSFAQNLEKDTIQLNEVLVKTTKKPKLKSVKYNSSCTHHEHLDYNTELVTLVDKLPAGYLHSVSFVFNEFMKVKDLTINVQDADLELVFYEAGPDGTPGRKIEGISKLIAVPKTYSGTMVVDIRELNVYNPGKIFIGLKKITAVKNKYNQEFEVNCVCYKNDKYTSFHRKDAAAPWKKDEGISAIEMKVKVEVL
jgi:hypothetical protein